MSERMLRFSEIKWSEFSTSTEDPLWMCLRKEIPVYFKVRRDLHLVYRHHRVPVNGALDDEARFVMGFDEELVFLPLDNTSLAELAVSPHCFVTIFLGNGISIPRNYHASGQTDRRGWEIREYEDVKIPSLRKANFYHAFLVNKKRWELAVSNLTMSEHKALQECKDSVKVSDSDLYFFSSDIDALKREAQDSGELVPYPFAHKELMPGIYWMFQAAHELQAGKIVSKEGVAAWLKRNAPKNTYRYKSDRTAKKFVWPDVDRAKGGGSRGNFDQVDLDEFGKKEDYERPFVSRGLSVILAVAGWWAKTTEEFPDETKFTLATKLDANKFGGLEIGHLVYLMSGSKITDDEVKKFDEYQRRLGKKFRRIVEREPTKKALTSGKLLGQP